MAFATIDGIATRYEVEGEGPPLLMYAPGGFDGNLEKWRTAGSYQRIGIFDRLIEHYTCITFDRREVGQSGGRIERVTWADYARQGIGLLDHLGIEQAHFMGACMGCSPVSAIGVAYPERVMSMVLYWPVGGVRYRMTSHARFARHIAYLNEHDFADVVSLVDSHDKGFGADPRIGPWGAVIRQDRAFADAFVAQDIDRYKVIVAGMARTLVDRDTAPGAEPEDLMQVDIPALIVPGNDASHATSAARYLNECLPLAEYWDVQPSDQTAETAPARVLEFLGAQSKARQ
jgi:pimeloyl-ACP methyl ester carboxylesterase